MSKRWEGCFTTLLLSLFFSFLFILTFQKISCFDAWWHLATGKWIWQNKAIPFYDVFSYTQTSQPWVDFTWGFQTLIYPVYHVFGIYGLVIFKSLILATAFFFLYKNLRLFIHSNLFIFTLLVWTALISTPRFMVRPHIFTLLFIAIFLYGLNLYYFKQEAKYLFLLLPIFVLWVNIHASFVLGFVLAGAYLFSEICLHVKKQVKDCLKIVSIRHLSLFLLSLISLSIFNPYGYKLLYFTLFSHGSQNADALSHIAEWRHLPFKAIFCFDLDRALWWRILFWSVIFALCGHIFSSIYKKKKINLFIFRDIILFVFFGYLCFKHFRFAACFAFVMMPIFTYWFKNLFQYRVAKVISLGFCLLLIYSSAKATYFDPSFKENFGMGIAPHTYPVQVMSFLKDHSIKGNIFNTYGFGGYLIWHLYPKHKVFIDGRTPTVYPTEFYWQYRLAERGNIEAFRKLQSQYDISIVITNTGNFAHQLIETQDYKLVAFDDKGYLLVKKDTVPEGVSPFSVLDATQDIENLIKKCKGDKTIELLETELKRAALLFPKVVKVNEYSGVFYAEAREDYEKASLFFQRCIKLAPYHFLYYYDLALTLKKMEENKEAIFYFQKALELNKKFPSTYYQLGVLNSKEKQYKKVIKYLKKYCQMMDDYALGSSYEHLGLAYYHLFALDEAEKYFKRALLLADKNENIRNNYYNLGNVYYLRKKYKAAIKYYEKALKIDPKFEKAEYNLKKAKEMMNQMG